MVVVRYTMVVAVPARRRQQRQQAATGAAGSGSRSRQQQNATACSARFPLPTSLLQMFAESENDLRRIRSTFKTV